MSTKTISIKTEAYERLKVRKKAKESFTDVINRLTGKRSLLGFAGILSKESGERLSGSISESRKLSAERAKRIAGELA